MEETCVVNIRSKSCEVYIGRSCFRYANGSIWSNPFVIRQNGFTREQALQKYEEYVRRNPALIRRLPELRGKILGCWCKPLPCHGDVLIKLLNEFYPES